VTSTTWKLDWLPPTASELDSLVVAAEIRAETSLRPSWFHALPVAAGVLILISFFLLACTKPEEVFAADKEPHVVLLTSFPK
jgi:hypothetical protein